MTQSTLETLQQQIDRWNDWLFEQAERRKDVDYDEVLEDFIDTIPEEWHSYVKLEPAFIGDGLTRYPTFPDYLLELDN